MSESGKSGKDPGIVRKVWSYLWSPHKSWWLGGIFVVSFAVGVFFWGGFNTAMEATNTEVFCISCHEMERNVYREYKKSVHYTNNSGVRATCPDCHVPRPWIHKIARKIQATNELYHHFAGTIDTRQKFESKRLELAENVWRVMKETDSRECRNCHNFDSMDFTLQESRAQKRHQEAVDQGKTCIDCHKGIAHELPAGAFDGQQKLSTLKD